MDSPLAKFFLPALIALAVSAAPAAAVEQNCRFIQAKPDREVCYKRQGKSSRRSASRLCRPTTAGR
jgi:hypothetical protein